MRRLSILFLLLAAICINVGCNSGADQPKDVVESGKNFGDMKKFKKELEDKKPVQ
ncbi:MAG: hypothetical protein HY040_09845 [Planctomycetes bacterium]|nr:hypothetical protein [Planctomycetota bacterium]